jgi:hypothetical protein
MQILAVLEAPSLSLCLPERLAAGFIKLLPR